MSSAPERPPASSEGKPATFHEDATLAPPPANPSTTEEKASQFMPLIVTGYGNGAGDYRFTVLFVPEKRGIPWEEKHDLTNGRYQRTMESYKARGSGRVV